MPGVLSISLVWIFISFENNFRIMHEFQEYLKEICRYFGISYLFPLYIFSQNCPGVEVITYIVGMFWEPL